jgi:hypothetical protein
MPAPNLAEADAFLSMTLYGDNWNKNNDMKKQQAINSAAAILYASYQGREIQNAYVYYQAAYMLTGAYTAASTKISGQSVSTGGVSQSFASGQRLERRDLLAPEVLVTLGDPDPTGGPITLGMIY